MGLFSRCLCLMSVWLFLVQLHQIKLPPHISKEHNGMIGQRQVSNNFPSLVPRLSINVGAKKSARNQMYAHALDVTAFIQPSKFADDDSLAKTQFEFTR